MLDVLTTTYNDSNVLIYLTVLRYLWAKESREIKQVWFTVVLGPPGWILFSLYNLSLPPEKKKQVQTSQASGRQLLSQYEFGWREWHLNWVATYCGNRTTHSEHLNYSAILICCRRPKKSTCFGMVSVFSSFPKLSLTSL
jgi:hypothetical protein